MREAVDRELASGGDGQAAWERALAAVGRYRGDAENVAVEHDAYLDGAYAPTPPA